MKLRIVTLMILGLCFFNSASAQHWCGTDHDKAFMDRAGEMTQYSNSNPLVRKVVDKRYVPLKFHLVADSQGNGRIPESLVYTQVCRLNEQYDSLGFVFYIDGGFNYPDNTVMYDHQTGAQSQYAGARNQFPKSVNVFLVNEIRLNSQNPDDTGTAGYYSGGWDGLVVRKSNFDEDNNVTFGHELGHHFSLAHPHVGWEDDPYDPQVYGETVTVLTVGSVQTGGGVPVELMNEVNCATAGDRICDTPPDYGFTQNAGATFTCHNPWEGIVKDRNGVLIVAIPNSVMGYNSCDIITFTHGQANNMRSNYDTRVNQNVINSSYIPDTTEITESISTIEPTAFSTVEFFNEVLFSWSPVEGAHGYKVVLSGTAEFEFETTEPEIVVNDLAPGASYSWTVYPINEIGTCIDAPATILFFTSSDEVSSTNEIDLVTNLNVHPNPIVDQSFTISFESESQLDASINVYDVSGKAIIRNLQQLIQQGNNSIPVQLNNAPVGLYNLIINTSEGIISEKLIVK